MKRPLLVFAGQSNMMGAAVYPAKGQITFEKSAEYLHKSRRLGAPSGDFRHFGVPCGEFSYIDLSTVYDEGQALGTKQDYRKSTFFCPAMCNLKDEETKETVNFSCFSEATVAERLAPSLPPVMVRELEQKGYACAYTQIAKGAVDIAYYLKGGAADYFDQKAKDFFADAEAFYHEDDTSDRILIWLQGESDHQNSCEYYKNSLQNFWARCKKLGFTRFAVIRVGFWGMESIAEIMRAQEEFCVETEDGFMLTRAASFLHHPNEPADWLGEGLGEEFDLCRDSYFGFDNHHINEKGFETISKYAVPNLIRVVWEGKMSILEEEKIKALKN